MKINTMIRRGLFDLERRASVIKQKTMEGVDDGPVDDIDDLRDRTMWTIAILNRAIQLTLAEYREAEDTEREQRARARTK